MMATTARNAAPDVGDAPQDAFEVIGRALAGTIAGNEAAVVFEVVGHVLGVEGDGGPEIAEEVDQDDVQHVVEIALPLEGRLQAEEEGGVELLRSTHLKANMGRIRRLLAKMTGMTPAWLTRRGRNWRVPP